MNSNQKKSNNQQKLGLRTIDIKHRELLDQFDIIETETIPKLLDEKEILKTKIKTMRRNEYDDYMNIRDRIVAINAEISKLKNKKKNYLLDNSKHIFNYFEQKKQISEDSNTVNQNSNVLNSFFKIKATDESADLNNEKYTKTKQMYQKSYWRNVTNEISNLQDFMVNTDICPTCNNGELIPQDDEGILICNNTSCGKFITYIVDSSKPTNKEPPNEVSYTAYIRLNHFKEILSQFQAKETTQIPDEVINAIKARIKKERITDMLLINYDKMREILRKLGFNKYFE